MSLKHASQIAYNETPLEDRTRHVDADKRSYNTIVSSEERGRRGEQKECESDRIAPNHYLNLEKSLFRRALALMPYILLLLVPLTFLALAFSIWLIHDKRTSATGRKVMRTMEIASTLWPIAFAAVLGPTLRTIALYKAQHGVRLRVLDALLNSNTLVSTVKAGISLRSFGIWTLLLLGVWALSPAGGQAVFRSLTIERPIENSTYALSYWPAKEVELPLNFNTWWNLAGRETEGNMIRTMFGAAMTSPSAAGICANESSPKFSEGIERLGGLAEVIEASKTDIWGNVRMPYLELLPGYKRGSPYDWVDLPTDHIPAYESLAGIPVRGLPLGDIGNLSFRVSAVYAALKCSEWYDTTIWAQQHPGGLLGRVTNESGLQWAGGPMPHFDGYPNIFMDLTNSTNFSDSNYPTIVFGDMRYMTLRPTNLTHIDAEVECIRATANREIACSARRARHSEGFPITVGESKSFGSKKYGGGAANSLLQDMTFLTASISTPYQSVLEAYLADPFSGGKGGLYHDLSGTVVRQPYWGLPSGVFDARLSVALNTVIRISSNTSIMLGVDGIDPTNNTGKLKPGDLGKEEYFIEDAYGIDPANKTGKLRTGARTGDRGKTLYFIEDAYWGFGNTTGTWSTYTPPVYTLHRRWFTLYVASNAVLIICVIVTVILRACIFAPDILGSVSAHTRDSPYFDNPIDANSTLNGAQLTRIIGEKRVRIGDVRPDDEIGRIAFAEEKQVPKSLAWQPRLYS